MTATFDDEVAALLRSRIARTRAAKGALAYDVGIDTRVLSQILSGTRSPTVQVLSKLCNALGISAGAIISAAEQASAGEPPHVKPPRPDSPRALRSADLPLAVIDDLDVAFRTNDPDEVDRVLSRARDFGWGLRPLGDALGLTRERVRQRVQRFNESGLPRSTIRYPESPSKIAQRERHEAARKQRTRVNGFKLTDPILQVSMETLTELGRLSELATATRTWTPVDAPERAAVSPYRELLVDLIDNHGISTKSIERALGYQYRTVFAWLARHGHGTLSPSQKAFKGIHISDIERAPVEVRRTIVLGGRCRQGHLITEDNMLRNGNIGYICGTCRQKRVAMRKRASRQTEGT